MVRRPDPGAKALSVTLADIEAARRVIEGVVLRTPMLPAPKLSALTGAEVYVKYENLQVTNSFKDRGALVKLASLSEAERKRGVIAMSAGNHAQAVAYHAARLGIPATIVMPVTTPFRKGGRDAIAWRGGGAARRIRSRKRRRAASKFKRSATSCWFTLTMILASLPGKARSHSKCWRTCRTSRCWYSRSAAADSSPAMPLLLAQKIRRSKSSVPKQRFIPRSGMRFTGKIDRSAGRHWPRALRSRMSAS